MFDRFVLFAIIVVIVLGIVAFSFPETGVGLLVIAIMSTFAVAVFRHFADDKDTVTKIFLVSLLARLIVGMIIEVYDLRDFFGGDAVTYDYNGAKLADYWLGHTLADSPTQLYFARTTGSGWGMNYLVGVLYTLFGRNIFAAQSFSAVLGAATAPLVYFCSQKIYKNSRVAIVSAYIVALMPAFVIWSSQLLKDGLILFLLVLVMILVLDLQKKFSYLSLIILVFSVFGIMSLRFYIFYMVAVAVAGSFVVGVSNSPQSTLRRTVALVLLAVGLMYLGVTRSATADLERYGSLETVQRSRMDLAKRAGSGFSNDVDISTTEGAISAVPLGFVYLMLAPFPWSAANLRQAITIPETLVWWAMIPLMFYGLWYTIKHRLRNAFPVLLFTLLLTIAYSVFEGNIGTAYRQRTQIQVFMVIFIAVGGILLREKREDRKMLTWQRRQMQ